MGSTRTHPFDPFNSRQVVDGPYHLAARIHSTPFNSSQAVGGCGLHPRASIQSINTTQVANGRGFHPRASIRSHSARVKRQAAVASTRMHPFNPVQHKANRECSLLQAVHIHSIPFNSRQAVRSHSTQGKWRAAVACRRAAVQLKRTLSREANKRSFRPATMHVGNGLGELME